MLFPFDRARLRAIAVQVAWALLLGWGAGPGLGRSAWGQTSVDGAISGFVVDASGAALAGASVQVQNASTGLESDVTAGAKGEFLVTRLPAGEYVVTVDEAGFDRLALHEVRVEVGGVIAVEARLQVGRVSTSVTVTAGAVTGVARAAELSSAAVASTITANEIERLPVNGRRWQTFALLTPTANDDPAGDGLLSFRGIAPTQNSSLIDGADDDQSFGAVPRGTGSEEDESDRAAGLGRADGGGGYGRHSGMAYTFSQEAVREFRVSGQNYSALYGHAAGGIITTVSKSGTNAVHGSGFYLVRDSVLDAANPFSVATNYVNGVVTSEVVKPHDLRQQFGGSVGGPVVRDKVFYFYAFDQQRRGFPAVSSPASR